MDTLILIVEIWLALSLACGIVWAGAHVIGRKLRVRKSLKLRRHCAELAERERRAA
jgi:hypothetical protein